ncbi:hypothetical protein [Alsobacter sp. SYSU BS001988]
MRNEAAASTILFPTVTEGAVSDTAVVSGFFPVLLYTTVGLALSVALLFSGLLTVPLETW